MNKKASFRHTHTHTHTHTHIYIYIFAFNPIFIKTVIQYFCRLYYIKRYYQLNHSTVSDSLQHDGLQHARLPYHQFPELTQTHVHRVSDAIQPYHLLQSPSPPAFNLSKHPGHFRWVSSSHQMAKVLEFQLQHQSFQWIFRTDFIWHGLVGSPCSPRDAQDSSPTPQFKSINSSVLSFLHSPSLTSIHDHWKNHSLH